MNTRTKKKFESYQTGVSKNGYILTVMRGCAKRQLYSSKDNRPLLVKCSFTRWDVAPSLLSGHKEFWLILLFMKKKNYDNTLRIPPKTTCDHFSEKIKHREILIEASKSCFPSLKAGGLLLFGIGLVAVACRGLLLCRIGLVAVACRGLLLCGIGLVAVACRGLHLFGIGPCNCRVQRLLFGIGLVAVAYRGLLLFRLAL